MTDLYSSESWFWIFLGILNQSVAYRTFFFILFDFILIVVWTLFRAHISSMLLWKSLNWSRRVQCSHCLLSNIWRRQFILFYFHYTLMHASQRFSTKYKSVENKIPWFRIFIIKFHKRTGPINWGDILTKGYQLLNHINFSNSSFRFNV